MSAVMPTARFDVVLTATTPIETNDDAESEKVLKIEQVDLYKEDNAVRHYTDKFHHQLEKSLVIRRGMPFKLKITFQRNFERKHDVLVLVFTVKDVPMPSYAQGTMIIVPMELDDNSVLPSEGWKAKHLHSDNDRWITIEVTAAATAIVGEWLLEVDTKTKTESGEKTIRYPVPQSIFLLFNPWCKEDQVYMANEEWKKEYVLQDTGLIWKGTYNSLKPIAWSYGQFEEFILETCCFLLRNLGKLNVTSRADPIKVSRHISAVVNSPDESGVVEGKWKPSYRGGENPTSWIGSQAILQKFHKKKKPVKYGQCWVFAGVCTTVCRCLGIPSRTITNYSSAHDTHNSLTVDYFYDEDGNPVNELNRDSVWNFHVWNEAWMTRPDLGSSEYNGWQVIDATPQEPSDGQYRCGPASVSGVKRGDVLKTYDSPFVFAEVNADKVFWRYHGRNKPLKLIYTATEQIGQFISTKAVGSYEREDVTDNYKYKEHTAEEREVMLKALRMNKNMFSRYYLNDEFEDVEFTFKLIDDIVIGSAFTVRLKAKSKAKEHEEHKIRAILRVDTVRYTGELKALVKKDDYDFKLKPGEEHEIIMKVSYSDYEHALADQSSFNVSAMATVIDTDFDYFAQDDFRVRMPDITIETEGDIVVGEEFTVIAYFTNPLPKKLKKGLFLLEGPGLTQPAAIKLKQPVDAKGEARVKTTMKPKTSGEKTIIVKFTSKELDDVDGYKAVEVTPKATSGDGNSHL